MPAYLLDRIPVRQTDDNGDPVAGALLYTYAAGTSTPQATFTDDSATTPHTNPIVADSDGMWPAIWIDAMGYKLVAREPDATLLWERDNVEAPESAPVNFVNADDYPSLQAALDTLQNVYVPGTNVWRDITAPLQGYSNQILFGDRGTSRIRQLTAFLNVIEASGKTGFRVRDLHLWATGDYNSYGNGSGVLLSGCSQCEASGVTVENHRGGGINLFNTNDSRVEECTFINSPVANGEDNTRGLADIAVVYSSSRNVITGNHCHSGNVTGIHVQAILNGDHCDDNVVTENDVDGMKGYGIIVYVVDSAIATALRNVVEDNSVRNISGTIINAATSNLAFGSGIYIQSAEGAVVSSNVLFNTHSGPGPFVEVLAPGAIGTANATRVVISGNTIDDCGMHGICATDALALGEAIGFGEITGNVITNTARNGINLRDKGRVNVANNSIDTTGDSGIEVRNPSLRGLTTINDNQVRNVTGTAGIEVAFGLATLICDNLIETVSTHGIAVSDSSETDVMNNHVRGAVSRGIQIVSTSSDSTVTNNTVRGLGATTEGIRCDSQTFLRDNHVIGCTAAYAGNFGVWRTLTVNNTTPSVAYGDGFLTANTLATTINNFTGGFDSQQITVVVRDTNTTFDFTGSALRGNNGVDYVAGIDDNLDCKFNAALSAWFCTIGQG